MLESRLIDTKIINTILNANKEEDHIVVKSKLTNWDAASWSTGVTDHVTRSDRYDRQYGVGGDDGRP